jgi:hypothetical protein
MAGYTDFGFMRLGGGGDDPPAARKPISENEKKAIEQSEREGMLEYMRHPSYKERLKREMFGDMYNESRAGQRKLLEREYGQRMKEVGGIVFERPAFDLGSDYGMSVIGEYVPKSATEDLDFNSPYVGQEGSKIYISQSPKTGDVQTNPMLYGQVAGHELGHASHLAKVGGSGNLFVKRPLTPPFVRLMLQHGEQPKMMEKEASFNITNPDFPNYSEKEKKQVFELASKRLGPGVAENIYGAISRLRQEQKEARSKYKNQYNPETHGPFTPDVVQSLLKQKGKYEYLANSPSEVATRMIGLRRLAAEKFGHTMNEDFDIRKYKNQIQDYFKKNGLIDEYEELSKDLELSDEQINEMMRYIARTKENKAVSYTG